VLPHGTLHRPKPELPQGRALRMDFGRRLKIFDARYFKFGAWLTPDAVVGDEANSGLSEGCVYIPSSDKR